MLKALSASLVTLNLSIGEEVKVYIWFVELGHYHYPDEKTISPNSSDWACQIVNHDI